MFPDNVTIFWIHLHCITHEFFHSTFITRSSITHYRSDMSISFSSTIHGLLSGDIVFDNYLIYQKHSIFCVSFSDSVDHFFLNHSFLYCSGLIIYMKQSFRLSRSNYHYDWKRGYPYSIILLVSIFLFLYKICFGWEHAKQ